MTGTEEIEAQIEGAKLSGDDFLEEFAMALEKRDGSVSFCQRIIGFLRLRDDNDFSLTPGVEMELEGRIPEKKAGIRGGLKGPADQRVGDTGRARGRR